MRSNGGVPGSITSELYVQCLECLRLLANACTLASQGDLRPVAMVGKRGACSSWLDDYTSQQETLLNAFVARYRGIACRTDCFKRSQSISIGYGCAYARHTPRATRHTPQTHPFPSGWCAWLRVLRLALCVARGLHHTHSSARGRGCPLAGVNVSVIGRTAGADNKKIRSKRAGWFLPFRRRGTSISRPE